MLRTLMLGSIKYLLKIWMPTLSKVQKKEVLARVKAFSTSGFKVRMYGNVCYYYQLFVGRDLKAWAQMAVFIFSPYLDDAQKKVLLSISKVQYHVLCFLHVPTLCIYLGVPYCLLQLLY